MVRIPASIVRLSAIVLVVVLAAVAAVTPSRAGTTPVPADRIVISLADRALYLVRGGRAPARYPVAIGRPGVEIPLGDTVIVRKRRDPTWRPTANQRRERPSLPASVPPGPDNPLGRHALDLGWPTYAIHGTNEPGSVGRRVSSGCFRMLPADIEAVFGLVSVGTPVRVVAESWSPREPAGAEGAAEPVAAQPVPPVPASPVPAGPVPAGLVPAGLPGFTAPTPMAPVADDRCAVTTAPLRRLICTTPELALLDGRVRALLRDRVSSVPGERQAAARQAVVVADQRFEERLVARCWIRKGEEGDPVVAERARACLDPLLRIRLAEVSAARTPF